MMVEGTADSLYKDNQVYVVSVIDMLSPEVTIFTCGLNDRVKEYPTRKPIGLTGAQIKMLLTCAIPDEQTETVDGLNKVVGHSEYPRFAITPRGLVSFPTEKATLINPNKNVPLINARPETEEEESPLTSEELEILKEPHPDRKTEMSGATREELERHAASIGVTVNPRWNRDTLVRAILKAEQSEEQA